MSISKILYTKLCVEQNFYSVAGMGVRDAGGRFAMAPHRLRILVQIATIVSNSSMYY